MLDLLQHTRDSHGYVHCSLGYIYSEILRMITLENTKEDYRDLYLHTVRTCHHTQFKKRIINYKNSKNDVFLFDLSLMDEIEELNIQDHLIKDVPHGLNIPVGIGFSLRTLPLLQQNDHWKKLYDIVIEVLTPAISELGEVGIRIVPNLVDSDSPLRL
jgi:hypothetical protein